MMCLAGVWFTRSCFTLGGDETQAKCTLGDETRNLHVGPGVTYAEMLEGVRMKFDNPPPFMLKYLDRCATCEAWSQGLARSDCCNRTKHRSEIFQGECFIPRMLWVENCSTDSSIVDSEVFRVSGSRSDVICERARVQRL